MGDEKGHEEPLGEEPISPERRADNFLNGWSARIARHSGEIADKVMGIFDLAVALVGVGATYGLGGQTVFLVSRGEIIEAISFGVATGISGYLTLAFGGTGVRLWREGSENPY